MNKMKKTILILIRVLSIGATVSAAIVMATGHENTNILSIPTQANYSDTPAFKYFLIANIIGSVYGFTVCFLPQESSLLRLVLISDVVMSVVLTSSLSAAMAIAELGKKGNSHAGWQPICGQFHNYCDHVAAALAAAFIALIFYTSLIFHSIHTLLYPMSLL
ncbi:hypothetical protein M9H77_29845 [Catharanthus roseus]|uniref:Uncharacterized protein n=1 Tax=Catharanthus roseus TaxID=4058 RepID=A0ACB9ZZT7_CATRO|nr:hypothetical protein M9H77_29845 [Catharanthus roseus]